MIGNSVTVAGNATRDPEHFAAKSGDGPGVVKLGVASNRRWTDKSGNQHEETSFFDVTCFGDLGRNVLASVSKGQRILIEGRLEQDTWEDNGQKRSKVQIIADDVAVSLRWAQVPQVLPPRSGSSRSIRI